MLARHPKPRHVCAALLTALLALDLALPPPLPDQTAAADKAVVVLARDGTPLRAFPDRQHVWRHPLRLEEVSPLYLEALLGYEDRWFRWHPGVNPFALARAFWQWSAHGHVVSGGSTLTMQVARILEPQPRSIGGKLRQILRALQLELRYSKDEILALYINNAPMGGVLAGVEAASRSYLGKPASRLSHAEAALLAVLPQAPSLLRPDLHPDAARIARDKVLRRMALAWGPDATADALAEPPWSQTLRAPLLAPLLAERLRRQPGVRVEQGAIRTSIDAGVQSAVEALLYDRARALPPHVSLAALVVDNTTLEVLAYAGSADFADAERHSHVDMVRAPRSPGSALKPFMYGFALDEGLIHSESLLADAPQSFSGYQPGNFQQSFNGPVSASEALIKSLNVPAVEVLERIGPEHFVARLRAGGLKVIFPEHAEPNLSVILGGASVTLENLVGAYTALARQGIAGTPRLTPDAPLQERRMLSAGAAFIIRDILATGGPSARAANELAGARRGLAWKTGTSFGFRDAWAIGVSDRHTVGIWVGRPDGTPNPGFFGANAAAPLLVDVFAALPETNAGTPSAPPPGVSLARICWPLGTRWRENEAHLCHRQISAWLLNDTAPPTFSDRLRSAAPVMRYTLGVDGLRTAADCQPAAAEPGVHEIEMARWPAVLEPWLDEATRQRALPPPWSPGCRTQRMADGDFSIDGLTDGEVLRHAAHTHTPMPAVRVRVHGAQDAQGNQRAINWLVDGRLVARSENGAGQLLRFDAPGRHQITALDDFGRYDRVNISVRE